MKVKYRKEEQMEKENLPYPMVYLSKECGLMTNLMDLPSIKWKIISFIKAIFVMVLKMAKESCILIRMLCMKACFKMTDFMEKEF